MTLLQIIDLARQMARTLRNGFTRAAHYLRSLGLEVEFAILALRGI